MSSLIFEIAEKVQQSLIRAINIDYNDYFIKGIIKAVLTFKLKSSAILPKELTYLGIIK